MAYQTLDLVEAMRADGAARAGTMRIDGGMADNLWLCQFLADILDQTVERPRMLEATALGAAFHAGLATGVWSGLPALERLSASGDAFTPAMQPALRSSLIAGWRNALARTLSRRGGG